MLTVKIFSVMMTLSDRLAIKIGDLIHGRTLPSSQIQRRRNRARRTSSGLHCELWLEIWKYEVMMLVGLVGLLKLI